MNYKLIIFDLDGTLVDSRPAIMAAMADMAREMGLSKEEFAHRQVHIGLPMADILRELGIDDIEKARTVYRKHYYSYISMERAFPGVPELLEQLRGRLAMSVATNKAYEGSLRTLGSAGIREYFDFIASLDQGIPKPDPDAFIRTIAFYREQGKKFTPEECLMVGDSPIDCEFARRSGIDFTLARWGYHDGGDLALQPTCSCQTPLEVLQLLSPA